MTSVPHSGAKSVTPGGSVAGHTPGPWEVVDHHGSLWIYPVEGAGMGWVGDSYLSVCIGKDNGGAANAALIASAPCLLELLQECRDYFASCPTYDAIDTDCLDSRCMEAIVKATAGETRNAEPIHRRDGDEG